MGHKFNRTLKIGIQANQLAPINMSLTIDSNTDVISFNESTKQELVCQFNDTFPKTYHAYLTMYGKTDDYSEFMVEVTNVEFDLADITEWWTTVRLKYTHDHNGHGKKTIDPFWKYLGCNGSIDFPFATPAYRWLENILVPNYGY